MNDDDDDSGGGEEEENDDNADDDESDHKTTTMQVTPVLSTLNLTPHTNTTHKQIKSIEEQKPLTLLQTDNVEIVFHALFWHVFARRVL